MAKLIDLTGNEPLYKTLSSIDERLAAVYDPLNGGYPERPLFDLNGNEPFGKTLAKIVETLDTLFVAYYGSAANRPRIDLTGNTSMAAQLNLVDTTIEMVADVAQVPTSLNAKLLAWWDASEAASVTLDTGQVTAWADKIGGLTPVQATAGFRPTLNPTSVGGLPGIVFDGTDDQLTLAGVGTFPTGNAQSEVFALVDQTSRVAGDRVIFSYGGASGATNRRLFKSLAGGFNQGSAATGDGTTAATARAKKAPFDGVHVLSGIYGGATVSAELDATGPTAEKTAAPGLTGVTRIRIGANTNNTIGNFWVGAINSIIVTSALTGIERRRVTNYLLARAGLL